MAQTDLSIGLYMRVSQADETARESDSIANQRMLLRAYVEREPSLAGNRIYEYMDDGKTGTNFDREAFARLIGDAKSGRINCIIVKDVTRFAREDVEGLNFIDRVFPALGVRFIALNNFYDSAASPGRTSGVGMMLENMMAAQYSFDLSKKVCSARRAAAGRGRFMGKYAPFGYRKSGGDGSRLEIDPPAAETVRMIYDLALGGIRPSQIARRLNEHGVATPGQYKRRTDAHYRMTKVVDEKTLIWTSTSVSRLLFDPVNTGSVVNNRRSKAKDGYGKSRANGRDEWIIAPNMHEPIVSAEEYDAVCAMYARVGRVGGAPKEWALRGKMKCGVCKRALVRKAGGRAISYCCVRRRSDPNCACPRGVVEEERILYALDETFKRFSIFIKEAFERKVPGEGYDFHPEEKGARAASSGRGAAGEAARILERKRLFEQYASGCVSLEACRRAQALIAEKIEAAAPESPPSGAAEANAKRIGALVERVYVYDERHVEVVIKRLGAAERHPASGPP